MYKTLKRICRAIVLLLFGGVLTKFAVLDLKDPINVFIFFDWIAVKGPQNVR